jgi:hypothetical protein
MSTSNTAYNADEPIYTTGKYITMFRDPLKTRCKDYCLRYKVSQRTPNSVFCKICDKQISRLGCYLKTVGLRCNCCKQRVRTTSKRGKKYA